MKEEKKANELDKSIMPKRIGKGRVEPPIKINKVENGAQDRKIQPEKHVKLSTCSQNNKTLELES